MSDRGGPEPGAKGLRRFTAIEAAGTVSDALIEPGLVFFGAPSPLEP